MHLLFEIYLIKKIKIIKSNINTGKREKKKRKSFFR